MSSVSLLSVSLLREQQGDASTTNSSLSLQTRIIDVVRSVPRAFCCGFLWEGFALFALKVNVDGHSPLFFVLTGVVVPLNLNAQVILYFRNR